MMDCAQLGLYLICWSLQLIWLADACPRPKVIYKLEYADPRVSCSVATLVSIYYTSGLGITQAMIHCF